MISSKAGQRLARARVALNNWRERGAKEGTTEALLRAEYGAAANTLADELIAGRHHEAEGD